MAAEPRDRHWLELVRVAVGLESLQSLCESLPRRGARRAIGVRQEFGVRWWTYRRLYDGSVAAAAMLRERGIGKGSHIVIWGPNSPEWVSLLLGAALRGVGVVPTDENASPAYVSRLANKVDAALVAHGPGQDVRSMRRPTFLLGTELVCDPHLKLADVKIAVAPDDPAVIIFTSGTTQESRGVILTHRNVLAPVSQFLPWRWLIRARAFRILVLSPLSHSQGLVLGAALPLSIGLSVLYTPVVDPPHLIRTIRDNRVTLLVTVPASCTCSPIRFGKCHPDTMAIRSKTVLVQIARPGGKWWPRRDASTRYLDASYRVVIVGGAVLPAPDEQFWRRSGCLVVQGYGLTETAAIVSVNLPWSGKSGSIGRPLPNQTIRLAEDGEILVRGPNVSPGYIGDDPGDELTTDGFLHTGDLARLDGRNRLYFVGRKKDLIVTGEGFNVYPQDVEAALGQQPGVRDSVVVGLPRDGHEEVRADPALAGRGGCRGDRAPGQHTYRTPPDGTRLDRVAWRGLPTCHPPQGQAG